MDLTDEQWAILEPLIPEKPPRDDGKGRPRLDNREVLAGILWALRTGAAWQDLPDRYPSPATCHRRFQEWRRGGVLREAVEGGFPQGTPRTVPSGLPELPQLREAWADVFIQGDDTLHMAIKGERAR